MTQEQANQKLIDREDFYFTIDDNDCTKYAAVVIDPNKPNSFIIEVGVRSGLIYYYERLRSLTGDFNENYTKINFSRFSEYIKNEIMEQNIIFKDIDCTALETPCVDRDIDITKYDELVSGISISNKSIRHQSGTTGLFFKMINNPEDTFLLSNSHILYSGERNNPEIIMHPSFSDGSPIHKSEEIGCLYWKDEKIDAAVAKITYPVRKNSFSRSESTELLGIKSPEIGMRVRKCGRTSGLTHNVIRSINCTAQINNSNRIKNLVLTGCMSHSGDSGSCLVSDDNYVVGLLIGSNKKSGSYFTNIKKIFSQANEPFLNIESIV